MFDGHNNADGVTDAKQKVLFGVLLTVFKEVWVFLAICQLLHANRATFYRRPVT